MAFSFLFPGQGSQYTGMFKEHFKEFDEFQDNLSIAEEFYKEDLKNIIFQKDSRLDDTYYTQPLLMLMSYSLFQVWVNHKCPLPKVAAGHSLGEVSAFLCAGGFNLKDALRFVKFRAKFMVESKGDTKTKMSAVLGLDAENIKKILSDKKAKFLEAINMNSPLQTVIAGNTDEIESVKNELKEKGAKKVIDLSVSVPSHTSLMRIASTKLKLVLDDIKLGKPEFPVIQNLHAKIPLTAKELCNNLAEQISNPVQWVSSMKRLKKYGLEEHFEIGPSKILSGLAKQNRIKGSFSSLDNIDTFKALLNKYGK